MRKRRSNKVGENSVYLLNFAHPITNEQCQQIESLIGKKIERVIEKHVEFLHERPYAEQIIELVDSIDLTPQQWQNTLILINPPSFNYIAAALLAELHGRMGYFPPCLRLRPRANSIPPEFEVAEIMNLNEIREQARKRRG